MRGTGTGFHGTWLSAALICAFGPLAAWAQSTMPKPGLSVIKTPAEDARPIDPGQSLPKPPVFHLVATPTAAPEPAYDERDADDEGYEAGYAGGYGGYGGYGDYGYYDPGYGYGRGNHGGHDSHDGQHDNHPRPPRNPGNSVTVAVPPPGTHPKPIGPVEVKVAPPPRQPPQDHHPGNGTAPGTGSNPGNGNPHR